MVRAVRRAWASGLLAAGLSVALATPAEAQSPPAPGPSEPAAPPTEPATPAAGGGGAASPGTEAPASRSSATGGYSYTDGKKVEGGPRRRAPRRVLHPGAVVATMPGFQGLADGSSRIFVQLSGSVTVEERKARGVVTYLFKGVDVAKRNNENPLVTVHMNTPVTRARLVPAGRDLRLVVDLRKDVEGKWQLTPATAPATGSVFSVEYPRGDYLPAGAVAEIPVGPGREPAAEEDTDPGIDEGETRVDLPNPAPRPASAKKARKASAPVPAAPAKPAAPAATP